MIRRAGTPASRTTAAPYPLQDCDRTGRALGPSLSGREEGARISLTQATLCAEYGLPNELHDSHASYVHHWMKILRGDKTAILHAAAKAEQAVKWLRQFDPALAGELKEAA
jgi:antirestriction protein ArdC